MVGLSPNSDHDTFLPTDDILIEGHYKITVLRHGLSTNGVLTRGAGRVVGQGGQLFSKGHFLTIAPDLTLP